MGNETVTGTGEESAALRLARDVVDTWVHDGETDDDRESYPEDFWTLKLRIADALEAHSQAFAQGAEAMREAAAKLAEEFATSTHIAADMRAGIFPKSSDTRDAIAAAIRALPPPPAGKPGGE